MKKLGELLHFLGLELELEHNKQGIFLCQQKRERDLLIKFEMYESSSNATPMEVNVTLCIDGEKDIAEPTRHIQLIGSLIYLTLTKLAIAQVVRVVSKFMQVLKKSHLKAACRILKYIQGTSDFEILYKNKRECRINRFCVLII